MGAREDPGGDGYWTNHAQCSAIDAFLTIKNVGTNQIALKVEEDLGDPVLLSFPLGVFGNELFGYLAVNTLKRVLTLKLVLNAVSLTYTLKCLRLYGPD